MCGHICGGGCKLYENEKQGMILIEIMHAPQNVADQFLINYIQFILVFWYEPWTMNRRRNLVCVYDYLLFYHEEDVLFYLNSK